MASAVPELPVLARDQAFEALYRTYVKDVYHYALALLRNPADAEDVTQTTFLNAYRAYQRGEEIRKPHNWLIKIAHNVARTRYARAGRRVKEVPLEDHVDQLASADEEKPNIEAVLRALGRLPFNQRAALAMRELEGRSYAEIADTLQVSVPAVETLIFRARKALRLRVSALRVLTAAPLPGSLTQLFETGVAGGGALVGTGFLVKAMVALVVGAVATGITGDRSGGSRAAANPAGRLAAAPAQVGGSGSTVKSVPSGVKGAQAARAQGNRHGPAKTTRGTGIAAAGPVAGNAAGGNSPQTGGPAVSSAVGAAGPTTAKITTKVTTVASNLVGTVEQTAAGVAGALPPLPAIPALPGLPALPAAPVLPALPLTLPSVPVKTPVVPPLPKVPKLP